MLGKFYSPVPFFLWPIFLKEKHEISYTTAIKIIRLKLMQKKKKKMERTHEKKGNVKMKGKGEKKILFYICYIVKARKWILNT